MERQKTNSITHLVKIIANEEIDKRKEELSQAARPHMVHQVVDCSEFLESIQSSVDRAYNIWTDEEDQILLDEYKVAVAQIAKNHGRSINAIKSRLNVKLNEAILGRRTDDTKTGTS